LLICVSARDLGLVHHICDDAFVIHGDTIVEAGAVVAISERLQSDYTLSS